MSKHSKGIKKKKEPKDMEDFDHGLNEVSMPAYLMISDKQARTSSEEMSGLLEHDFKKEKEEKTKNKKTK